MQDVVKFPGLIALCKLRNEMQTHCVHGSFLKSKYLIKICKIYVVKFSGLIAIIYTSQQKKRYNIFYIEIKNRQQLYNLDSYGHSK